MTPRLPAALALLALLLAGLWWVASLAPDGDAAEWQGAVHVVGPDGEAMANGTVTAEATPLAALHALAGMRGFVVDVEQQTWVGGGCTAAYVRGIGGVAETASGGWNYYVRSPGGSWTWRPEGAACYALSEGQEVEWCWVESDVCRHHVP